VLRRHPQGEGLRIVADYDGGIDRGMTRRDSFLAQRGQNQAASFFGRNMLAAPSVYILGFNSIVWNSGVSIQPPV